MGKKIKIHRLPSTNQTQPPASHGHCLHRVNQHQQKMNPNCKPSHTTIKSSSSSLGQGQGDVPRRIQSKCLVGLNINQHQ